MYSIKIFFLSTPKLFAPSFDRRDSVCVASVIQTIATLFSQV